jgi:thiol-disulfide isomerase/thioredoxin
LFGVLSGVLALLAGCGDSSHEQASPAATLVPVTHAQWEQRVPSYAGNVVVVDFWATWCAPCVERFPKMIAMSEHYRDHGVRFVSMCMEDRDDQEAVAGARRFLNEKHATMDNFLLDEPLLDGFKTFNLLSIPAVYLYDRNGALTTRLTADDPNHQFNEKDVEAAIEALLAR